MAGYKRKWTAAEQHFALKNSPIAQGSGSLRHRQFIWVFEAQPTPMSRKYRVRIEYREGENPRVVVMDPDLTLLAADRAKQLPHVYTREHPVRLCLYNPDKFPWTPYMFIALTIVPWTYLWLYFFEEWLFSNDWKGGGDHPGINDDKKNANSDH
ncbi:MAG: hypothetical protein ACYC1T_13530 [Sulfuricaulis sp.]